MPGFDPTRITTLTFDCYGTLIDWEAGAVAHVAEGVGEIAPARRLGCATVWVRRNGRSARLLAEAPDREVPDLQTLLALTRGAAA